MRADSLRPSVTSQKMDDQVKKALERNGTVLRLTQRALATVPKAVFCHVGLVRLDLSRNSLTELPSSIHVLTGLQYLNLSWNSLVVLPNSICRLKSLKTLLLEFNKLAFLPEDLGSLSSLTALQANDNKIAHVPESTSELSYLSELNLEYNNIEILPNSLCLCGSKNLGMRLGMLKLRGNPFLYPPMDIIVDGTAAIISYLRRQHTAGQSSSGRGAAPSKAEIKSPEIKVEKKGGVSFYVEHDFGIPPLLGDTYSDSLPGPSRRPGGSSSSPVNLKKYTDLHKEVEELIENYVARTGIAVPAEKSSPSRPVKKTTTTTTTAVAGATTPTKPTLGSPHLSKSSSRHVSPSRPSPNPSTRASRADHLRECITTTSSPAPAMAVPTTSSDLHELHINSTRKRQSSFAKSFYESRPVVSLRGLDLGASLTVNGMENQADNAGSTSQPREAEEAASLPPEPTDAPPQAPGPPVHLESEQIDIVEQLLKERNPMIANAMRDIVNAESEEEEDGHSSSDETTVDFAQEAPNLGRNSAASPSGVLLSPVSQNGAKIPKEFLCPITHEVMRDPVVLSDGHTYERTAIETWLKKLGRTTSPMTGAPLESTALTPNFTLRSMIKKM